MFRQSASATAVVLVRSRWRQRETGGAPGVRDGVARTLFALFVEEEEEEEDDDDGRDSAARAAAEVSCRA